MGGCCQRKKTKTTWFMKMMCVKSGSYHLTPGKIYNLKPLSKEKYPESLFQYLVVNDVGYEHYVEGSLFVDLSVIREKRLRALGI